MGLTTTHDAFNGSYTGFNNFRRELSKLIGIDWDSWITNNDIDYLKYREHNLFTLLNHSDCDGILTVEECIKIKKGLEEILPLINEEWKNKIITFINGCEKAIELNEKIEFF